MRHRVCLLLKDFRPGGGVERVFETLAKEFSARDVVVDLALMRTHGEPHGPWSRVVQLSSARPAALVLLQSILQFRRYLRDARPDLVISAKEQANLLNVLGRDVFDGTTHVVSRHVTTSKVAGGDASPATRLLLPFIYKKADVAVVVSRGLADEIKQRTSGEVDPVVIYNPILDTGFRRRVSEVIAWPFAPHDKVVIGVGRLERQKGFDLLIRAVALLDAAARPAVLLLGDGSERRNLERLASQLGVSIVLCGHVENPLPFMKAADVFVLPSRWEGFGNVLAEAVAVGVPVVAADCPHGPREILRDGELGILVPPADVKALCAALRQSLDRTASPINDERFVAATAAERYLSILSK